MKFSQTVTVQFSQRHSKIRIIFLLETVFERFENPNFIIVEREAAVEVGQRICHRFVSLFIVSRKSRLVVFWLFDLTHEAVVQGLIGVFIRKSEPGSVELLL